MSNTRRRKSRRIPPADPQVAIAYIRLSKGDDKSLSVEAQEADINRWCSQRGVRLARIERDVNVCGGIDREDREGLMLALAGLEAEHAGVLLVAKRDRLARDALNAALLERDVSNLGARIESLDGVGSGSEPTDIFQRQVLDAVAELERGMIRARTKRALAVKRERGERFSGKPPYGWEFVGTKKSEHLQKVALEQAAIKRIVELRAAGFSYAKTARRLNEEGYPARGTAWFPGTIREICLRENVTPGAALDPPFQPWEPASGTS